MLYAKHQAGCSNDSAKIRAGTNQLDYLIKKGNILKDENIAFSK